MACSSKIQSKGDKKMKYANCHLHSTYSDGRLTPRQLVVIGKSLGYKALALTDHETDGGYSELCRHAEAEGGIETIPGIEFYGMFEGYHLHLTALDYDMDDPALRALVKRRCELRYECTKARFALAREKGYVGELTWDDVEKYAAPGSWFCPGSLVRAYEILRIPEPENVIHNVFKTPEAAALSTDVTPADLVIKTVRGAGGIIALAHPVKWMHLVPALVDIGLNGIEVSHPKLKDDLPDLTLEAAKKYNLYYAGGTDHDGAMSGLGGSHAYPTWNGITEEEFHILRSRALG